MESTPHTDGHVIHWAARYDLLVWVLTLGRERKFRENLLGLARVRAGESVLDVGCGTGTLAIAAKRQVGPSGAVHGIDPSPEMIARARRKARKAALDIAFGIGVAGDLPFSDGHFDVVLSTVMLHHLRAEERERAAREMRRVLKPGGRVLAVDFAGSWDAPVRHGFLARLHGHRHGTGGGTTPDIVHLLGAAGLNSIETGSIGMKNLQFVLATPAPAV